MSLSIARVQRHGSIRHGALSGACAALLLQTVASAAAPAPAASAPAAAVHATVNPSLFQALQWRGIGPYRGGRALAVAGIPGESSTFYFGAVAGGV